jgi:hypothetical protein
MRRTKIEARPDGIIAINAGMEFNAGKEMSNLSGQPTAINATTRIMAGTPRRAA